MQFNDPNLAIGLDSLMALFDHADDVAFFVKDSDGRYTAVNNSLVERHGLNSKLEVIGNRPSDICRGEYGEIPTLQDKDVLSTGRPLLEHLEMHWGRPDKPVWCLTTKLPLRDKAGNITGLVGVSRDVRMPVSSDQIPKNFAKALAEFESTLSSEVTPAWLAERSGMTAAQLNRFAKRLFGLTPRQLISKVRVAARQVG